MKRNSGFRPAIVAKKALTAVCGIAIITLVLVSMQCFGDFFEGIAVFSAAAQMPQGAIAVAADYFKTERKDVSSVASGIRETSAPESIASAPESESAPPPMASETQTPAVKPADAGKISEYAILPSTGSPKIICVGGAYFSNTSKQSNESILKILKQSPNIKTAKGKPQVLIYHTHSTESYEMQDLGYYIKGSAARSTDEKNNMIRVGDAITKELESAGFTVIHDRSLYDYPSYGGAYYRSADKVKEYLEKYPSITVTLDIHRDAIEQSDGTRVKPTVVINGKKAAQVMIIAGVDDGTMDFPDWKENMKFASKLQQQMEKKYPTLTRAAMVCHRRYNMYLTKNSLLIEVGGHANTLSEAVYSGEMIGKSLSEMLKEYGKP